MTEEKIDPRIVRTKEAIQSVFKKMVCEMPYEKITVKAITEAARINRNTFYLHYNCVDDVLAEIQAKHSSEYSAIVSGFDQLKDWTNWCVLFLNTWKLRMIFSSVLPATAVLTISAKGCRIGLQSRRRNPVL